MSVGSFHPPLDQGHASWIPSLLTDIPMSIVLCALYTDCGWFRINVHQSLPYCLSKACWWSAPGIRLRPHTSMETFCHKKLAIGLPQQSALDARRFGSISRHSGRLANLELYNYSRPHRSVWTCCIKEFGRSVVTSGVPTHCFFVGLALLSIFFCFRFRSPPLI